MAVTLVPVMINQWFSRYKSTGAGIACAGATAGSFALPPIIEYAIEEYGLSGAFLMMAGITLNGLLGAALMRPAHWLRPAHSGKLKQHVNSIALRKRRGDQNLNFLKDKSKKERGTEEIKTLLNGELEGSKAEPKVVKSVRFSCHENQRNGDANEENRLINDGSGVKIAKFERDPTPYTEVDSRGDDPDTGSIQNDNSEATDSDATYDDEADHYHYGELQLADCGAEDYDPKINIRTIYIPETDCSKRPLQKPILKPSSVQAGKPSSPEWLKGILEPGREACSILRHPMFLIIASNYSIFFLSYMTYLIVIVDFSLDLGIDRTDCVFLVSTFSIADLAGRLGSGWLTDSGIVQRKHLMMGNMVVFGSLLVATSFATTYAAVTAVSVCAGVVVGVNLILFYALLEEYLGIKKLPMAIGLMNFSIGIVSLVTPLLTGYFRDTMGSYDHLFHLLGGVSVFCGLLWVLEPLIATNRRSKVYIDVPA